MSPARKPGPLQGVLQTLPMTLDDPEPQPGMRAAS